MPNYVYNTLTVTGSKEDVLEFGDALIDYPRGYVMLSDIMQNTPQRKKETYDKYYNRCYKLAEEYLSKQVKEKCITFNGIVPMPLEYQIDLQGVILPNGRKFDVFSEAGWYGWSCNHWGTKWDVSEADTADLRNQLNRLEFCLSKDPTIQVYFDTAWSAPDSFMIEASKKFPKVTLDLKSEEESGMFFTEKEFNGGEVTSLYNSNQRVDWLIYNDASLVEILDTISADKDVNMIEYLIENSNILDEYITALKSSYGEETLRSAFSSYFLEDSYLDKDIATNAFNSFTQALS